MSFRLLSPLFRKNSYFIARISKVPRRTLKTVEGKEENNKPIKYTTSKAGEWQAKYTNSGKDCFNYPKSQSTFVVMSLTAFMVYFCILREENDLDDWMRSLETDVPLKLEEVQLRQQIEQGRKAKTDVSAYELRLQTVLDIQEKVRKSCRP